MPWKKGQSGNPSGRPRGWRGMAAYLRSQTKDGTELANLALEVMRNRERVYTHAERWEAMKWIADRAYGKAINTTIELTGEEAQQTGMLLPESVDVTKLEELDRELDRILDKVKV